MPRLILNTECKACGEPAESRYCPRCIDERSAYADTVWVSARQYDQPDGDHVQRRLHNRLRVALREYGDGGSVSG